MVSPPAKTPRDDSGDCQVDALFDIDRVSFASIGGLWKRHFEKPFFKCGRNRTLVDGLREGHAAANRSALAFPAHVATGEFFAFVFAISFDTELLVVKFDSEFLTFEPGDLGSDQERVTAIDDVDGDLSKRQIRAQAVIEFIGKSIQQRLNVG